MPTKRKKRDIRDWKEGYGRWVSLLLDALFPLRCPFCDELLPFGRAGICPRCRKRIRYIDGNFCLRCGKQLEDGTAEYCRDCRSIRHSFDRGRSVYIYGGPVRESLVRFKYKGRGDYARIYGREMVSRLGGFIRNCRADIIIPVPVHRERERKRGYNQAYLIAREISHLTGIPIDTSAVIREKSTRAMKELTREDRMKNLKGSFKITAIDVKCRNVLIVDDIYTTGSTVDEIAGILKEAGIRRVFFVTLASGTPV